MRQLLACWMPSMVAQAGMMSLPLTCWQHRASPLRQASPTSPSPIFTHSTTSCRTAKCLQQEHAKQQQGVAAKTCRPTAECGRQQMGASSKVFAAKTCKPTAKWLQQNHADQQQSVCSRHMETNSKGYDEQLFCSILATCCEQQNADSRMYSRWHGSIWIKRCM